MIYQLDAAKIDYKKTQSAHNKYKYLDILAKIQVLVLQEEGELSKNDFVDTVKEEYMLKSVRALKKNWGIKL